MKKIFILVLSLCLFFKISAQDDNNLSLPKFKGNLERFFADKIKYPPEATKIGLEGNVAIRFKIMDNGQLDSIRVIESPGKALTYEVKRILLQTYQKWISIPSDTKSYIIAVNFIIGNSSANTSANLLASGNRYLRENNPPKAIEYFDKALKYNPYSADIYLGRTRYYKAVLDTINAKLSYEKFKQLKSEILLYFTVVGYR